MASITSNPDLPDYTRITSQVYVRPREPNFATDLDSDLDLEPATDDPTTILIYGWGDAAPKHVLKYALGYQALYPNARIVLVLSPIIKTLSQNLEQRSAAMLPVVQTVFGVTQSDQEVHHRREKILVHIMSNTGGINFAATLYAYQQLYARPMPYQLLVCDSTPGSVSFLVNVGPWSRAMALGIPLPSIFAQAVAAVVLAAIHAYGWLVGAATAAAFSTVAVSDRELSTVDGARLYMYSKADSIISWRDIELHAADARKRGYAVMLEEFEGTPHVGHMRVWPKQYWTAIAGAWEASKRRGEE